MISKNNFLLYLLKCIYISVAVGEISLPQLNAYLLHRILLIYIYVFALHQKGYPSWMKQLTIKENVLFSILWYTSLGHKSYVRESISKHVFIGTKVIRRYLVNLCTRLFLERYYMYHRPLVWRIAFNVDSYIFWYSFFSAKCICNVAVTYHIDCKNMKWNISLASGLISHFICKMHFIFWYFAHPDT